MDRAARGFLGFLIVMFVLACFGAFSAAGMGMGDFAK